MLKSLTNLFGGIKPPEASAVPEKTETNTGMSSFLGKIFDVFKPGASDSEKTAEIPVPQRLLNAETLDEQIDEIEEILIRSDVGPGTAMRISDQLRANRGRLKTVQDILAFLRQEFTAILASQPQQTVLKFAPSGSLSVFLVVGVNGAGKTTLIGKLAHQLIQQGKKVVIGAGDTFRAAAVDQLQVWADRAGARFVGGPNQGDPAAVVFDALKAAREQRADVVLLDTAGRLQNKLNLMEELRKIRKVIDRELEKSPGSTLESLLVLDATTGQNALRQADVFKEAVDLTGVVLTKLDGSAKGGVILSVAKDFGLPVKLIGVGEKIEDLKPFHPTEFVDALFQKN